MTKDEIIIAQQARITELETTPPDKREDLRCVISDLCHQVRERDEKIVAQQARIEQLLSVVEDLSGLIDESSGVYGLHLNGDPSPWEELLPGGRFERITNFYEALAATEPKSCAHSES